MSERIPPIGEIIRNMADPITAVALSDLFALGCVMHDAGDKAFGLQLCLTALRIAGTDDTVEEEVTWLLPDHTEQLLDASGAHAQVKNLYGRVALRS